MTDKAEAQPVTIAWRNPFKAPTVQLGENLITDASRVTVDCQTGGAPKIFLEFEGKPVEDLQFDGVVHIVREVAADPLKVVDDFLAELDGSELQRAVLESLELGDGEQTFGDAALKVLRGWARGD
jgi:hypothetical protein